MDYRVIKYNNVIWKLTCRLFEIQIGSFTLVRLNTFFNSVSLVIICSCLLAVWFGSSFAWCFKFYKNNGLYSEKVKYVKHLYFFFDLEIKQGNLCADIFLLMFLVTSIDLRLWEGKPSLVQNPGGVIPIFLLLDFLNPMVSSIYQLCSPRIDILWKYNFWNFE